MQKDIEQLLQKLISFSSISQHDNVHLTQFIKDYAQPFIDKLAVLPQPENKRKESLLLKIGSGAGGLVLSGHLDVVPVAGQPWESDPFTLIKKDGKYYGRGVVDMKGFIACALAMLPRIKTLRSPLYLALTCDEEIGCLAAPQMANALRQEGAEEAFVWVGEPTLLQPVVGQKGITNLRTTVYGQAAHSSQIGQGISAVHVASQLVVAAEDLMYQLRERTENPAFDVPFTSIHVGKMAGGIAVNVMAEECSFEWEIRHLPETSFSAVFALFQDICTTIEKQFLGVKIVTTPTINTVAALHDGQQAEWLALLSQYLEHPQPKYVAYATEAGIFQQQGFQTLICGPGSISQAHQANEWIEISQLQQCAAIMQAVIAERCQATFLT